MGENAGAEAHENRRRPAFLTALAVLLFLDAALVAATVVWLLFELLTATPSSYASAVAILVLAALAAVWLVVTALATLRGRSWVRAAAITWQILQLAIAVGFFQGQDARPTLAWALLVPALIGVALALSPAVVRATARPVAGGDTLPAGGDTPAAGGDTPPAGGDTPPAGGDTPRGR
ncbi:hypothetical protein OSC27_02265 [Microbacterium sp. STN6]|uniref:hypothetical protein n=1 Tax=Microbacterium sp. STN6 TaxID=2995588 RepID=UPI002261040A|nr:hypothetical protein [Microbacterium sp. STN6]MCX7521098.1 hypothetical protein [Microbacterium sp. STN6]